MANLVLHDTDYVSNQYGRIIFFREKKEVMWDENGNLACQLTCIKKEKRNTRDISFVFGVEI